MHLSVGFSNPWPAALGPLGLDSELFGPPGPDSCLRGPPGLHFGVLGPPGLDSGVLGCLVPLVLEIVFWLRH